MSLERLRHLHQRFLESLDASAVSAHAPWRLDPEVGREFLQSMLLARHLDFAAQELHRAKVGLYTIASAGHEANLVLGRLTRITDLSLLHYRSAALFLERARQVPEVDAVRCLAASLVGARTEPASGGRHKVFGHAELGIIPQTSTIGSHLPRAVGLAFGLGLRRRLRVVATGPRDALVVAAFGDASINHSTWLGAVNACGWAVHQGIELPLLLLCEDNGLGISVRSPPGWVRRRLEALPHVTYFHAPAADVEQAFSAATRAVAHCRRERKPAVLHLECMRLLGHWGEDRDEHYRSAVERSTLHLHDPLSRLACSLLRADLASPSEIAAWDHAARERVASAVDWACREPTLGDRERIGAPIAYPMPDQVLAEPKPESLGEGRPLTLARGIQAALAEGLERSACMLVFGEDVAQKGGIFGVTQGLQTRFGKARVFDTLLDEQTILGVALGTAMLGFLPVAEIQYLAFVHNALDQLRGEAAMLPFLSGGTLANPMLVRIASFAQPAAPGGHFHNDHSVAMLRDIPGLVVAVPCRADDALALYRRAFSLVEHERRVVVVLEPTALYQLGDLHVPGDGGWLAVPTDEVAPFGRARVYGSAAAELLMVSYGRGVVLALQAARRLESEGLPVRVLDLRWLAPLPIEDVLTHARAIGRLLVVDDCRRSGGIAEAIAAAVLESAGKLDFARVTSADCFVPIGPVAQQVLVSVDEIVVAGRTLCRGPSVRPVR